MTDQPVGVACSNRISMFHYVDNGVGMEAVAVTCCDLGDMLFRGARETPDEVTISWDDFLWFADALRTTTPAQQAAPTPDGGVRS